MTQYPAVSIVIASRSRADHLRHTLRELKRQDYLGGFEVIVLDDASPESLKPVVDEAWPTATFIRKQKNIGQCACRTEGFRLAKGKYILQLDDDAHPVASDCVSRAITFLEERAEIGILSCYSFNGPDFPPGGLPPAAARYWVSFHGCAAFFRSDVVRQMGGYLDFLERHWEEEDLSIRVMKAGWAVYFASDLQIHHRLSKINRSAPWTWKYGVRNKLWGLVMYWPLYRLPLEVSWTLALALWDGIRLRRLGALAEALYLCVRGLPRIVGLRSPMDSAMMRRYDALRFGVSITTREHFERPPSVGITTLLRWFSRSWWNRPRERSAWDRRPGDLGASETVKFAHEYQPGNMASKR